MAVSLSTPVTGAAQTGFTSPTYTLVSDQAPDVNSKQYVVTALGGTQVGVTTSSINLPFTIQFYRPKTFKTSKVVNGVLQSPRNVIGGVIRKGVNTSADDTNVALFRFSIDTPAGAETTDAANVRALISAAIGALNQVSAGLGDTAVNGVF